MRIIALVALCSLISISGYAGVNEWEEQLSEAIYRAEGGTKAHTPYGVESEQCDNMVSCKQITINSIRNNMWRYLEATDQVDAFIEHMSKRWCPLNHQVWANNVKSINRKG
jgi:hypothetical protein